MSAYSIAAKALPEIDGDYKDDYGDARLNPAQRSGTAEIELICHAGNLVPERKPFVDGRSNSNAGSHANRGEHSNDDRLLHLLLSKFIHDTILAVQR